MSQEPYDDRPPGDEIEELPPPGPPVPWRGTDLLLVVVFIFLSWVLSQAMVLGSGLFAWAVPDGAYLMRTLEAPEDRKATQQVMGEIAGPTAATIAEPIFWRTLALRLDVWARTLVFPLQVILLPLLLLGRHSIPASTLGITWTGWPRAVVLALIFWVVLTPIVLGLNTLVATLYSSWMQVPEEEHALVILTRANLLPIEWIFWVALAVVIHPVLEEFLFRGLLQPYVLAAPARGYFLLVGAIVLAYITNSPDIAAVADRPGWEKLDAYMPVLFVLVLGVGFLATQEYAGGTRLPGYIAVSMLFAAVHSTWPHPVALFVLSLGLCYLRDRSGSLMAPVLLHGLFNATSTVLYFLYPV